MLIDAEGRIVALDFGIMGRLDLATRRHLAEILVGFLSRDYARVAAVFFRAGLRAARTRTRTRSSRPAAPSASRSWACR